MTDRPPAQLDTINAIFGPFIGFFVGMAVGYTILLAFETTWWFAMFVFIAIMTLAMFVLYIDALLDRISSAFFRAIGWEGQIKQPKVKPPKHWFNKTSWVIGLGAGILAVFVLPQSVLDWLL